MAEHSEGLDQHRIEAEELIDRLLNRSHSSGASFGVPRETHYGYSTEELQKMHSDIATVVSAEEEARRIAAEIAPLPKPCPDRARLFKLHRDLAQQLEIIEEIDPDRADRLDIEFARSFGFKVIETPTTIFAYNIPIERKEGA